VSTLWRAGGMSAGGAAALASRRPTAPRRARTEFSQPRRPETKPLRGLRSSQGRIIDTPRVDQARRQWARRGADLVRREVLAFLEPERVEANVPGAVDRAIGELEEEGDLEEADEPEYLPESAGLDGRLVKPPHLLALVPLVDEREVVQVLHETRALSGRERDAVAITVAEEAVRLLQQQRVPPPVLIGHSASFTPY